MKKIFYLIVVAVMCVRCDVMDTSPLDQYTADVIWSDKSLAQSYLYNTSYDVFHDYVMIAYEGGLNMYHNYQFGSCYGSYTDDLLAREHTPNVTGDYFTIYDDAGWDVFDLIRQANVAIEGATIYDGMSDADKANIIAQAKVLRSMTYFKHVRIFGGAILIDRPLTADDELKMYRSTLKESYDFVIDGFLTAAPDLDAQTTKGNISGTLAYGLAAQAALQAAAYVGESATLSSEDSSYNGLSYYDVAIKASEDCLAIAGGYSLSDDYWSIFNDYGNQESNSEIILAFSRASSVIKMYHTPSIRTAMYASSTILKDSVQAQFPLQMNNFTSCCYQPTWDLIDEYEVLEGDVAKKWTETDAFKNFRQGTDYVYNVMSVNRDQRYYDSFVLDSMAYGPYDDIIYTREGGNQCWDSGTSNMLFNTTGVFVRKGIHDKEVCQYNTAANYHHVMFRLGTVYLNYAEALLRKGRISEGVEWMNKTRVKHGNMPEVVATSFDDAWVAYKSERRKELFFEADDRYNSLLRWAKIDGDTYGDISDLSQDVDRYYEISNDGKSFEETSIPEYFSLAKSIAKRVWSERRFLFPIPNEQILLAGKDENGNDYIEQNPLW